MKVFTLLLFPVTLFDATVAKEDDLHIMNGGSDLKILSVHSGKQQRKLQMGGMGGSGMGGSGMGGSGMGGSGMGGSDMGGMGGSDMGGMGGSDMGGMGGSDMGGMGGSDMGGMGGSDMGGMGGSDMGGMGGSGMGGSGMGGMGGMGGMRRRELGERNSRRELGSMLGSMPEAPALPSSYSYNPSLFNDNWKDFTVDEFYEALQCEQMPLEARPIHDASTWSYLRQTYEDIVGSGRSSIHKALSDIEVMDHSLKKLLPVQDATSVVVNKVPKKGRGIHASRDIKEGEHIWSDVYLAAFYDTNDINRFLAVIPPQLACDIILWKYDYDENPNDFFFSVNLDSSSFCNDGGSSNSNIMWQSGPIANDFVASRDINAGEEILCDYGYDNTYE